MSELSALVRRDVRGPSVAQSGKRPTLDFG